MKVIVLVDKFKNSIDSMTIGNIVSLNLSKRNIKADYFPISDGGNGFLSSVSYNKKYVKQKVVAFNADNERINTFYYQDGNVGYIESAMCVGVKNNNHDIYKATSRGLGKIIKEAFKKGVRKFYIGLGGTLTNDGGKGMLEELGFSFNDKVTYKEIIPLNECNFICVTDVNNKLLGKDGATYVYAMQKGAKEDDLPILEKRMEDFALCINKYLQKDYSNENKTGAAGGLGFAFLSLLKAKLVNGLDFILDYYKIDSIIDNYDYIITGEGKIDHQSLQGKVVCSLQSRYKDKKIIAICGENTLGFDKKDNIIKIYSIVPNITDYQSSMKEPIKYLNMLLDTIIID